MQPANLDPKWRTRKLGKLDSVLSMASAGQWINPVVEPVGGTSGGEVIPRPPTPELRPSAMKPRGDHLTAGLGLCMKSLTVNMPETIRLADLSLMSPVHVSTADFPE